MNFTQNTLNIYNNYLFKHCNAVVPDFCTPQDSHSVRDKAHFLSREGEWKKRTRRRGSEEGERKTIISKTIFKI